MISEEFLSKYKHTPPNKPLNKFLYKENLYCKINAPPRYGFKTFTYI